MKTEEQKINYLTTLFKETYLKDMIVRHLMENIVYNELRSRGYSVDVGAVEKREATWDGKTARKQLEIDFIANLGSKRLLPEWRKGLPVLKLILL